MSSRSSLAEEIRSDWSARYRGGEGDVFVIPLRCWSSLSIPAARRCAGVAAALAARDQAAPRRLSVAELQRELHLQGLDLGSHAVAVGGAGRR